MNKWSIKNRYDPAAERSGIVQLQLHGAHPLEPPLQIISSDSSWSCGDGPIQSDSTYYGEIYDARLETPGCTSLFYSPTNLLNQTFKGKSCDWPY